MMYSYPFADFKPHLTILLFDSCLVWTVASLPTLLKYKWFEDILLVQILHSLGF